MKPTLLKFTFKQKRQEENDEEVRRKENMLADRLANEGVANKDKDSQHAWESLPKWKLREDCFILATKDWDLWMNNDD